LIQRGLISTYLSDEKEEELRQIIVNLYNGRIVRRLWDEFKPEALSQVSFDDIPDAECIDFNCAYMIAREKVVCGLLSPIFMRKMELRDRFLREKKKVEEYYETLSQEFEEDLSKVDPQDAGLIHMKINSCRLEKEKVLKDLSDRFRLRVNVELINILLVNYAKLICTCRIIEEKKRNQTDIQIIWDPLLRSVEPPNCPTCSKPSLNFTILHRGKVFCSFCEGSRG
jgi:hypothetical protein